MMNIQINFSFEVIAFRYHIFLHFILINIYLNYVFLPGELKKCTKLKLHFP